jgi:hypothetical protein
VAAAVAGSGERQQAQQAAGTAPQQGAPAPGAHGDPNPDASDTNASGGGGRAAAAAPPPRCAACFVTTRILVVDLLSHRIRPQQIAGAGACGALLR